MVSLLVTLLLATPLPALPLSTQGRWIVDATGKRIKLASVNWYGAEEKDHVVAGLEVADRRAIARRIRELGFNSVRLPWSNEMYELNPVVKDAVVAANPDLKGKRALEVLDAVIEALSLEGLVIVLDNHVSAADWPWSEKDGNGLWYTAAYPERKWLADWRGLARRYRGQPAVVAADLRNEPRPVLDAACTTCTACPCDSCTCRTPVWGGGDPRLDWAAAAARAGNAVLAENPNLLIIVEGVAYATDLSGVLASPVTLAVPHRLVYSAHDYAWFHPDITDYASLKAALSAKWGFLLAEGQPYTAPVWVGEFGTCHTAASCVQAGAGGGLWFSLFRLYLYEGDVDWAYWAVNGTQAHGTTRTFGAEETYGVLDVAWRAPALRQLLGSLRSLQPASTGP